MESGNLLDFSLFVTDLLLVADDSGPPPYLLQTGIPPPLTSEIYGLTG